METMKEKILIIIFFSLLPSYGTAQFMDKYGFNLGATYTTQFWDYKLTSIAGLNKDYKTGFSVFLSTEKKLNKLISIRPEIGYIQKGFKNNIEITFSDSTTAGVDQKNVSFHDLGLNIGLKITPFDFKFAPYAVLGIRADYMISYKDIIITDQSSGLTFNMYTSQINTFNKANLGGLISLGFEFREMMYVEIEYNPSITYSFNSAGMKIKDNCWGVKIGININKLSIK